MALCAAILAAACSDATQPTAPARSPTASAVATITPGGEKLVSIGTSISMGWASNGVWEGSQHVAWPELMRFGGGGPISLPLIQSPGCQPPLTAPLGNGVRLGGEPDDVTSICAPNEAGVALPAQNVALAGAITSDALLTTSEDGALTRPWYSRVLPPGTTQVTAALSQAPTVVSVELGGNDVLDATSGLLDLGHNVVPLQYFETAFQAVLNAVGSVQPKVLVLGLPADGTNLPAMRRSAEVWADRFEFAALHVDVNADCETSPNYINVSSKSLELVFTAAFTSTHGLPNPVFDCADFPGTRDLVLTPDDITTLNGLLGQMTIFAQQEAASRGYAFVSIGVLYDRPDLKPPVYSVIDQLTSTTPFGPYISLDGVHPSPLGHSILAKAAARALNKTYPGIAAHSVDVTSGFGEQLVQPAAPAFDLAWAKLIARRYQGRPMAPCLMSLGCSPHSLNIPR